MEQHLSWNFIKRSKGSLCFEDLKELKMNQIIDIVVIFLSDFVFVFATNVFSYVTSIVDQ